MIESALEEHRYRERKQFIQEGLCDESTFSKKGRREAGALPNAGVLAVFYGGKEQTKTG